MNQRWENLNMQKWRFKAAALVLGLAAPLVGWAQNTIQAITSSQQAGTEVIRIELSEPLAAVPNGFTVQAPPRVAIDLPGIGNGLGRSTVDINQGNLRSVNVAQAGDRTRLVFNLKQAANYKAELQGKVLVVVLEGSGSAAQARHQPDRRTGSLCRQPEPRATAPEGHRLPPRSRWCRPRGGWPGQHASRCRHSPAGPDLVVEFLRSTLPDALRRKLDVTDFGTPVQTVSAQQTGDRVRLVVEPRGSWEHSAYQTDNQFVLEVRPMKIDPNKLTQGPGYAGEKLSLNFQNIEVRALLQVIADFTNFNVVTSDTVTGSVTLRLKDVPWDQALDIILQSKGLGVRKSGNVLWIAPKDELAAKEKLELESRKQITDLEPVRMQSFQLNYTKAEDVAKGLAGQGAENSRAVSRPRILSPRGSVISESADQPTFRHRHSVEAGRDPGADRQDRHPGAAGHDRSAHRRSRRQVWSRPGRQARCARPQRPTRALALAAATAGCPCRQATTWVWANRPAKPRSPPAATSRTRSSSVCPPTPARSAARRRLRLRCRCSVRRPTVPEP